jgi:hypothetical protein
MALMPLGQTAEPEEPRVTALVAMPFSLLVTRVSRLLMRVEERPSSVMTPEKESFAIFDSDGSGKIDAPELSKVLKNLGEESNPERVQLLIDQVDSNHAGEVSFPPHLSSLPAPYPDLVLYPDLIVGSRLGLDPVHCSVAPSSLAPPRPSPDQDEESSLFLPPAPYLDVVVGSRWVWIPSPSRRPSLLPG